MCSRAGGHIDLSLVQPIESHSLSGFPVGRIGPWRAGGGAIATSPHPYQLRCGAQSQTASGE